MALSLRGKFIFTLSIGVAAMLCIFCAASIGYNLIDDEYSIMRSRDIVGRIAALEIAKDINYQSRLTRNIMLGGDIEKDLHQIAQVIERVERNFNTLEKLDIPDGEKELVAKAERSSIQFLRDGQEIVANLKNVPVSERHIIFKEYEQRATPLAVSFREHYGKLDLAMSKRFEDSFVSLHKRMLAQKRILWLILGAAIVSLYAAGYLISNKDLCGMRDCVAFAAELGDGGLSRRLAEEKMASMNELARELNATADNLARFRENVAHATAEMERERDEARMATEQANEAKAIAERATVEGMLLAARQLEGVVEVVSSASEELSSQIAQSSRGAEEQSTRVAETSTAMEEMTTTVLEVAQNAQQAATTSDDARRQAQEGADIVGSVVKGIDEVRQQSEALKADMAELGRQAEAIGQIMNVISDIADQTNLLALNAAIEAARAGDAGRGFAVVADEVRKLAEKTMTATKEVGDAIRGIQVGTRKNMENVDRSAHTIEQATDLATRSGESLNRIVKLVDQASDQVRSIATASEQQSSASEEISKSVEQVANISAETAQAMSQANHSVSELTKQAQILRNLITNMKREGETAYV